MAFSEEAAADVGAFFYERGVGGVVQKNKVKRSGEGAGGGGGVKTFYLIII